MVKDNYKVLGWIHRRVDLPSFDEGEAAGRSDFGVMKDYENGHKFFLPLYELLCNVTLYQQVVSSLTS